MAEEMNPQQRALYARVAYDYYRGGLTQDMIAKRMHMTRQRVNRMLKECVDLGIVHISIEGEEALHLHLEALLEQRYGLRAVRLVDVGSPDEFDAQIGHAAAAYLASIVKDGDIIGFSRGRTPSAVVDHMPPVSAKALTVTQLMGGWNKGQPHENVDDIVHRFSRRTGATPSMLFAPILVERQEMRESIFHEPYFQEAYRVLRACTVSVVGIGGVTRQYHAMDGGIAALEAGCWDALARTAVGEICTYFFDTWGRIVPSPLYQHILAILFEDFLRIPTRIGVAGLATKHEAVRGAVRGGLVNVLITDKDTAQFLLTD